MRIVAACTCHTGLVRSNNEDNFYFHGQILEEKNDGLHQILNASEDAGAGLLCGVFDGMGGEANGETASFLAARKMKIEAMKKSCREIDLTKLLLEANEEICTYTKEHNSDFMGSTAVVLRMDKQEEIVANLGDSRAFLFRGGTLTQVSVDHTNQAFLERLGIARRKPQLTQHLGIDPMEMLIEPFRWKNKTKKGDVMLICSDGLTDMLDESEIRKILLEFEEPNRCVAQLLAMALAKGGRDNTTMIVCKAE